MRPDQCGGSFAERDPLAAPQPRSWIARSRCPARSPSPRAVAPARICCRHWSDRRSSRCRCSREIVRAAPHGWCRAGGAAIHDASVIQGCRRHAGQPAPVTWSLGAARPAHLDRLDLVVERMPGQHQVGAFRRPRPRRAAGSAPRAPQPEGRSPASAAVQRIVRCAMPCAWQSAATARASSAASARKPWSIVTATSRVARRTAVEMILEEEQQGQRIAAARDGGHHRAASAQARTVRKCRRCRSACRAALSTRPGPVPA